MAQIVKVTARRGTFLHVRHGPLLIQNSPSVWKSVFEAITQLAKKEHCWFVRTNPLLADTDENRRLLGGLGGRPSAIHAMDGELCWVLDLDKSEDELLAQMRKTTRYEIRKAMKLGGEVKVGTGSDLTMFLRLYKETSFRHGFVPHQGIAQEFETFSGAGQAQLLLGSYKGEIIAGAIILFYGNQAIYHHGASARSPIPVSSLVQWEAIKIAKKRGFGFYNFWGIAPDDAPHHPWRGISLFKKGFGGHEVRYIHSHDIPISPLYLFSYAIESLRRELKGYS